MLATCNMVVTVVDLLASVARVEVFFITTTGHISKTIPLRFQGGGGGNALMRDDNRDAYKKWGALHASFRLGFPPGGDGLMSRDSRGRGARVVSLVGRESAPLLGQPYPWRQPTTRRCARDVGRL